MTSRSTLPPISGNNRNTEALRGMAALLVAYFHGRVIAWVGLRDYWHAHGASFSFDSMLAYLSFPMVWGAIGVPIFFVISGYCIHRGHASRAARQTHYRLDVKDFWLRRFIRIYPVLLCALLLTLALDSVSLRFFPHNERLGELGWATFDLNLLALQGIAAPDFGSNGALWTLSLEIQFYALYPLLFAAQRRLGRNRMLAGLALLSAVSYGLFERRGITIFTSYWLSWYLGAYIAELQVAGIALPSRRVLLTSAAGLLALGCAVCFPNPYAGFQIWALAFALFFICVLRAPAGESLFVRAMEKLGAFSYSLYVVHLPIFVLLTSWLFHSKKPDSILYSLAFLGIAVLCAFVFHLVVERPAIRFLEYRSARPASAAPPHGAGESLP